MVNSIWFKLQADLAALSDAWSGLPVVYRAGGCLLAALFLMWRATSRGGERDRMFFVSGFVALVLLAYGALMFVQGSESPF
jgi:hypothetical protein